MPCYNAGSFLPEAIESVLNQTYRDIEIIALDDCSTDDTLKTLKQYAQKDSRIRLTENPVNLGLIKTLNKGIDLAKGKYIARMDQDDICLPQRFEKQIELLETDGDLDLVSCRWMYIDEKGKILTTTLPRTFTTKSNLIESFFGPPFGHPTIMLRTAAVKKFYYRFSDNTKHIEDYDLFARMLLAGAKTKVINEVLFKYRSFSGNTTHTQHPTQSKNMIHCANENLIRYFDVEIPENLQELFFNRQSPTVSKSELREAVDEFIKFKNLFIEKTELNAEELKQVNHFASNHVLDILLQYLLKNQHPSRVTVARIIAENLKSVATVKNFRYTYSKLVSQMRRRLRN